jgi:glutamate-ammonia-ligase adenylyltransferase
VSSPATCDYQRERLDREHQALVRARVSAAMRVVRGLRAGARRTLGRPRDAAKVRADVVAMRLRMRAELDRSDAADVAGGQLT